MSPSDVEAFLREHIPLTRALGCSVVSADFSGVRLRAPLAPNVNPHGTAFAGSLASLAVMCGWVWVVLALRGHGEEGPVVVRRCEVDYLAPVESDFEIHCRAPESAAWQTFTNTIARRGRARLVLRAMISTHEGMIKVRTKCEYAARRGAPEA
jgi:thioesterase domain-containing protein